jgi:hypothetical protein
MGVVVREVASGREEEVVMILGLMVEELSIVPSAIRSAQSSPPTEPNLLG